MSEQVPKSLLLLLSSALRTGTSDSEFHPTKVVPRTSEFSKRKAYAPPMEGLDTYIKLEIILCDFHNQYLKTWNSLDAR